MTPLNRTIQTTDPFFNTRLSYYECSFPQEFPVKSVRGLVTAYLGLDDLRSKLGFFSIEDCAPDSVLHQMVVSIRHKDGVKKHYLNLFQLLIKSVEEEKPGLEKKLPFPVPSETVQVHGNLAFLFKSYPLPNERQQLQNLIIKVNANFWICYLNYRSSLDTAIKKKQADIKDIATRLGHLIAVDPIDSLLLKRVLFKLADKRAEILASLMEVDIGVRNTPFVKGEILLAAFQVGCSFTLGDLISKRDPQTTPKEFVSKFSLNVPQLKEKLLSRFFEVILTQYNGYEGRQYQYDFLSAEKKEELSLLCSSKEWDSEFVMKRLKGFNKEEKLIFFHRIGLPIPYESEDLLSLFDNLRNFYIYQICCIFVKSSPKNLLPLVLKRILHAFEKANVIYYDDLNRAFASIHLLLENLQSVDPQLFKDFESKIPRKTSVKLEAKKEVIKQKIREIMDLVSIKQSLPPLPQASSVVSKTLKRKIDDE